MARPLSLTPAIANLIVAILEQGQSEADAYTAAGVGERTFFVWTAKGKKAEAKSDRGCVLTENEATLMQFYQGVKKARATGKTSLVDIIRKYALDPEKPRNWHAAAWLLERMHPAEFGRKYIRIEGGGIGDDAVPGGGGEIVVNVTIEGTGKPPEAPPAAKAPAK